MLRSKLSYEDLKEAYSTPYGRALLIYYVAMAIVGLLIPDGILRDYPWARDFADFMAGIMPQIDRITALGLAPDVNRFYYSVLWAGSPILAIVSFGSQNEGRITGKANMWVMPFSKAIQRMVASLFLIAWGGYGLWEVDPSMRLSKVLFLSPIGRALFGQMIFHVAPVFLGVMLIAWTLGWLTGYIPRNIKRHQNG
jgi:hypothetical protein